MQFFLSTDYVDGRRLEMRRRVINLATLLMVWDSWHVMNASEVIEQFKRLSPEEQDKVVEYIQQDASTNVRYADDESVLAAAKTVFAEHPELFRKLAQ